MVDLLSIYGIALEIMNPNTGGRKFEWQIIRTHRGPRTIFRSQVFGFVMPGTFNI